MAQSKLWLMFTMALLITTVVNTSLFSQEATKPSVPMVYLSGAHANMCRVKVGDTFPIDDFEDASSLSKPANEIFGSHATVVVVWQGNAMMTRALLSDLRPHLVIPYGDRGVSTIGIAVGQDAATTQKQLGEVNADIPFMIDPNGELFAKLGTKALPRVYVLDANKKIVWFDIEYSLATERELKQSLEVVAKPSVGDKSSGSSGKKPGSKVAAKNGAAKE